MLRIAEALQGDSQYTDLLRIVRKQHRLSEALYEADGSDEEGQARSEIEGNTKALIKAVDELVQRPMGPGESADSHLTDQQRGHIRDVYELLTHMKTDQGKGIIKENEPLDLEADLCKLCETLKGKKAAAASDDDVWTPDLHGDDSDTESLHLKDEDMPDVKVPSGGNMFREWQEDAEQRLRAVAKTSIVSDHTNVTVARTSSGSTPGVGAGHLEHGMDDVEALKMMDEDENTPMVLDD